jgi:hypothetical protein
MASEPNGLGTYRLATGGDGFCMRKRLGKLKRRGSNLKRKDGLGIGHPQVRAVEITNAMVHCFGGLRRYRGVLQRV